MGPEARQRLTPTPSPQMPQVETDRRRIDAFERLLSLFPAGRLIDLGAGHGKLSIRAARLGWNVVAVDARTERFPTTKAADFRHGDIRDVDLTGYDLILCLGLFYHLTLDDQRSLLARCAGTPLIIDTHLADGESRFETSLGPLVEIDGLRGRWFGESNAPTASWGNDRAFWPTPESFGRLLQEAGYGVVLEAHPAVMSDRRFYVALPHGYTSRAMGVRGATAAWWHAVRFRASARFRAARTTPV